MNSTDPLGLLASAVEEDESRRDNESGENIATALGDPAGEISNSPQQGPLEALDPQFLVQNLGDVEDYFPSKSSKP